MVEPPFEVSSPPPAASSFSMITLKDLVASQEVGRKQLEEMLRFLKVKIEFEDRLALELNRAVKIPLDEIIPPRTTSLNLALWHLRSYTDQRKTDQTMFAIAFEKQVRHPLERVEASMRSDTVQLKIEASRSIKSAAQAEMRLRRARATLLTFPQSVVTKHNARRHSSVSTSGQRLDKYSAAKATAASAKKEAMLCIEARDKAMDEAAAATRALEKNRAKQMKLALERFVNLERQNLAARSASLDHLQQAVKAVDTEADIARVAQYLKGLTPDSASTPPPPPSRFSPSSITSANGTDGTASMTQTVSYAKALALLDWDWKRQLKAAQLGEDLDAKAASTNNLSSDSNSSWAGGILPPLPDDSGANITKEAAEIDEPIEGVEEMVANIPTDVLIRDLLFGISDGSNTTMASEQVHNYPKTAYSSVASEIVDRCVTEKGRAKLLQSLNECRTGEVDVPNNEGRFEAVVSVFIGCLGICDEQRDVKHAKQFMIMSETIFSRNSANGAPLYVQSRVCDHDLWSRRWFWEDVLLIGITEQFDLSPQDMPWEDLPPETLHDEVLRVHNTVFAQLGAIVSNMVRFGRSSVDIRKFLAKMSARSQLNEDMCLQLNKMLESALNSPNRRASLLPVLPDSSHSLSFQNPNMGQVKQVRKPTLESLDDEASDDDDANSSTPSDTSSDTRGRSFSGILARKGKALSSDGDSESENGRSELDESDSVSELGSELGSEVGSEPSTTQEEETITFS